jgi:hypothetical protein
VYDGASVRHFSGKLNCGGCERARLSNPYGRTLAVGGVRDCNGLGRFSFAKSPAFDVTSTAAWYGKRPFKPGGLARVACSAPGAATKPNNLETSLESNDWTALPLPRHATGQPLQGSVRLHVLTAIRRRSGCWVATARHGVFASVDASQSGGEPAEPVATPLSSLTSTQRVDR